MIAVHLVNDSRLEIGARDANDRPRQTAALRIVLQAD